MYLVNDKFYLRKISDKLVFVNKYKSNELYVVENNTDIFKIICSNKIEMPKNDETIEIIDELLNNKVIEVCYE